MDPAVMISHRNMIFSTSQLKGISEELAKVYTVRCPHLRQECINNFQIASFVKNSCSFGSLTLVSYNGRTCLHLSAVRLPQHVSHNPPLECRPDREGICQVIICFSHNITRSANVACFQDIRLLTS